MKNAEIIERLFALIEERRSADPANSYVAKLYAKGLAKIAQKVGEEGLETALAAVQNSKQEVVYESADLLFHMMVLWADMGLTPDDIFAELSRREGLSGLDEKNSRDQD
ncbi:MAG: phosphoribosyl-ATP diphosphatase [Kordiimonas sp.]|nr:phosphoribosyl-ATP diphosphatase [Kordiimonas sp.]|tara:strand:+ start:346 stop:672 length:327 start_codon:yes stop_codon:yes gene_type:complete